MNGPIRFYRRLLAAFAFFLLFAIWGFWPSYFSRLFASMNIRLHLHGIGMTLWCLMLVTQATLIIKRKNSMHKQLGRASFVLVPYMVFSTLSLLHFTLRQSPPGNISYYFSALVINALIAFLIFYGLAIYYRRTATVHSRYMLCTILPMVTPITDRLIFRYLRHLAQYAPKIDGRMPVVPMYGFLLVDTVLTALIFMNWREPSKRNPYILVLVTMLVYHFSVLNFHQYEFWKSFSQWFISIPMI